MYRVRIALVTIFSVHCVYFRALEVKKVHQHNGDKSNNRNQIYLSECDKNLQEQRPHRCIQNMVFLQSMEACLGNQ